MMSLDELILEISKKSEYSEEDIRKMIEEKQDELSGLVSEEGAAYIIARELGLTLLEEQARALKVKDIVPGMFSIDIKCKIAKITPVRTFRREGNEGAVQNILMGDETGIIRMSVWNDEIDKIKELGIGENNIVKLTKVLSKEDNLGNSELRLGRKGSIEKAEGDIALPASASSATFNTGFSDMIISQLKAGSRARVKATLIQIFKRKPYYDVCAKCEGKVERMNEKWLCKSCGETDRKINLIVSGTLDDGYGNIRAVFFREDAEKILGKTSEDVQKLLEEGKDPAEIIYDDIKTIGKGFIITGNVKENNFTNNIELVSNSVEIINIKDESEKILDELEKIEKMK